MSKAAGQHSRSSLGKDVVMIFFWLIPVALLVLLALIWFTRRAAVTSPADSDSDLITTDKAIEEDRNDPSTSR